jgi:uncharacterized membrane protein
MYKRIMAVRSVVAFLALLGACIWIGGSATLAVVARVARRQIDSRSRVAFFRALGRSYLPLAATALALALAAGAWLLGFDDLHGIALATLPTGAGLVLAVFAGVTQARAMTRLRTRLLEQPADATLALRVQRAAVLAAALRATIGLLSLALLALAGILIS